MCIEFNNMEQKKRWGIILKTKVPAGRERLSRESCTIHLGHNTTSTNCHKERTTIGSWTTKHRNIIPLWKTGRRPIDGYSRWI
jgi:hypothetical protein